MNDAAGAALMLDAEKYPVALAMMHPTSRPMTTAQDFMMGLPNLSHMMIVAKTEKPRPIYSALPQGRAWGAPSLGQTEKMPLAGRSMQPGEPDPPAQF